MNSSKKILIIFGAVIIIFFLWLFVKPDSKVEQTKTITISQKTFKVEIADTVTSREQGLSDRENLCSECGLLFIYDNPGIYSFWMKRMHFDIDILRLAGDEVVDITFGAKKPSKDEFESPKTTYQSQVPVDKVLEVNAGWVEKNGIKVGDRVKY